jgi:hypothetical protein
VSCNWARNDSGISNIGDRAYTQVALSSLRVRTNGAAVNPYSHGRHEIVRTRLLEDPVTIVAAPPADPEAVRVGQALPPMIIPVPLLE